MSPPAIWGPPIWKFFHSLVENIKDEHFNDVGFPCFNIIKQICKNLPCPDCSNHATQFLSSIRFQHIKTKNDFKHLIYIFHNVVNKKKNKPLFNVSDLNIYNKTNIIQQFNNFVASYKTRGQMKLMADGFARDITVKSVKKFLMDNTKYFNFW